MAAPWRVPAIPRSPWSIRPSPPTHLTNPSLKIPSPSLVFLSSQHNRAQRRRHRVDPAATCLPAPNLHVQQARRHHLRRLHQQIGA
uniref:Uncharacterized protein n=1 Tax=Triticum urartu TaxID=4572 RepID=A0A8R7R0W1_TRIUA